MSTENDEYDKSDLYYKTPAPPNTIERWVCEKNEILQIRAADRLDYEDAVAFLADNYAQYFTPPPSGLYVRRPTRDSGYSTTHIEQPMIAVHNGRFVTISLDQIPSYDGPIYDRKHVMVMAASPNKPRELGVDYAFNPFYQTSEIEYTKHVLSEEIKIRRAYSGLVNTPPRSSVEFAVNYHLNKNWGDVTINPCRADEVVRNSTFDLIYLRLENKIAEILNGFSQWDIVRLVPCGIYSFEIQVMGDYRSLHFVQTHIDTMLDKVESEGGHGSCYKTIY